eukprot:5962000-Ditylum_brightwellii.AAC.1
MFEERCRSSKKVLIIKCTLLNKEEEGCILSNWEAVEPSDKPVSLPAEGKEDDSKENEVSSVEGTTITNQCTTTMIQTAIMTHLIDTADLGGAISVGVSVVSGASGDSQSSS